MARGEGKIVQGVAVGDLDNDGALDVVTASDSLIPPWAPYTPSPSVWGSALDAVAMYVTTFLPQPDGSFVWSGAYPTPGTLTVELNGTDVHMAFVEMRSRLQDLTQRYGLFETLDRDHFYPTIEAALAAIASFTDEGEPRHDLA